MLLLAYCRLAHCHVSASVVGVCVQSTWGCEALQELLAVSSRSALSALVHAPAAFCHCAASPTHPGVCGQSPGHPKQPGLPVGPQGAPPVTVSTQYRSGMGFPRTLLHPAINCVGSQTACRHDPLLLGCAVAIAELRSLYMARFPPVSCSTWSGCA